MNFKKLIRKLKYLFGQREIVYSNGPFDMVDTQLIMDRDVCVSICKYDEYRGIYIVLVSPTGTKKEC